MSLYAKQFFKALLIYALSFGIIMSIGEYVFTGAIVPVKMIIQTILFGIVMALVTTYWQKRKLENQGIHNPEPGDFEVNQKGIVETNMDLAIVKELLSSSPDTANWTLKADEQKLKYSTGMSLKSWGEKITIEPENGKLIIKSQPKLKTTLFDYGRNRANVELAKKGDRKWLTLKLT